MDDLTGCRLNDYQLLRLLGRGAMATVYLAEQQSLARRVAVKVLNAELCRDPSHVGRFQHEARAAASLVHPGIVQVYEVGVAAADGAQRHYLAQEYVAGGTLSRLVEREGCLAPGRLLEVLWQVATALDAAAERGLVHRDIKPDNLMIDRTGVIKVADFGLARLAETSGPRMTQAGIAMGTPLYMSPEQIEGGEVDARSDLYSLGVTAYQLLTGEPPFTGDTPLSVAIQHLNNKPDPIRKRRPDTPAPLAEVIDRLIAKRPADRFQSPGELLGRLAEVAAAGAEEGWASVSGGFGRAVAAVSSTTLPWAPRSTEDMAAVTKLASAMQQESIEAATRRRHRRRAAIGAAAGMLIGAGVALWAVPSLPVSPQLRGSARFETVQQQLFNAKSVDTPEAWRAVIELHPNADAFYHNLARRGLALSAIGRGQHAVALAALEPVADDAFSDPLSNLAVAMVRVIAYAELGQIDLARAARAPLVAAGDRGLEQLREELPELSTSYQAVVDQRL
ncbi:serine/threonine-protein kinase [Botrimarina sp.]|uniref:serine/threonine-protein kinase n=1 Tax=Botrimarina sp. TaxID=2795802 RepID=UPI0032EC6626